MFKRRGRMGSHVVEFACDIADAKIQVNPLAYWFARSLLFIYVPGQAEVIKGACAAGSSSRYWACQFNGMAKSCTNSLHQLE